MESYQPEIKNKVNKDGSYNKIIGFLEIKRYLKNEISLVQARELILIKTIASPYTIAMN